MKEEKTKKMMKECCPRDSEEELNYDFYKSIAKDHLKLLGRLSKLIPTEELTKELKRRKVIRYDYGSSEWKSTIEGVLMTEKTKIRILGECKELQFEEGKFFFSKKDTANINKANSEEER